VPGPGGTSGGQGRESRILSEKSKAMEWGKGSTVRAVKKSGGGKLSIERKEIQEGMQTQPTTKDRSPAKSKRQRKGEVNFGTELRPKGKTNQGTREKDLEGGKNESSVGVEETPLRR